MKTSRSHPETNTTASIRNAQSQNILRFQSRELIVGLLVFLIESETELVTTGMSLFGSARGNGLFGRLHSAPGFRGPSKKQYKQKIESTIEEHRAFASAIKEQFVAEVAKREMSSGPMPIGEFAELMLQCLTDVTFLVEEGSPMHDIVSSAVRSIALACETVESQSETWRLSEWVRGSVNDVILNISLRKEEVTVEKGFVSLMAFLNGLLVEVYGTLKMNIDEIDKTRVEGEAAQQKVVEHSKEIVQLKRRIRELEGNIKDLNAKLSRVVQTATERANEAERLKRENKGTENAIIGLQRENEALTRFKDEVEQSGVLDEKGVSWHDISLALDTENGDLRGRITILEATNVANEQIIAGLEKKIAGLEEIQAIPALAESRKCEESPESCEIDELLTYLVRSRCGIQIKRELCELFLGYIHHVLNCTTKGASSSTRGNSHKQAGAGGGRYANQFLNPMMNLIKKIHETDGTHAFLEVITHMEWGKLITDYTGGSLGDTKNIRNSSMMTVFNAIPTQDRDREMPIGEALLRLADALEALQFGQRLDLSGLAQNIRGSVDQPAVKRRLQNIVIDLMKTKNGTRTAG